MNWNELKELKEYLPEIKVASINYINRINWLKRMGKIYPNKIDLITKNTNKLNRVIELIDKHNGTSNNISRF